MIQEIVLGLVLGAGYGAFGYVTKSPDGEAFDKRKFARTTLLHAVAGVVVALSGGELTGSAITEQAPAVSVVGVAFDHMWRSPESPATED